MTSSQSTLSDKSASVQASHQRPLETSDSVGLWVQRLSLAAGGLAAVSLAPSEAQAAIVYVDNNPISVGVAGGNVAWDIDNAGAAEFTLYSLPGKDSVLGIFNSVLAQAVKISAQSGTQLPLALNPGDVIGFTPPGLGQWGYIGANMISGSYNRLVSGVGIGGPQYGQFTPGLNFFGFRFAKNATDFNNGNFLYGWGEMDLQVGPSPVPSLTITRWAYETTPNQSIAVPGPLGLAGLAAGAAWSRKLRRRIREAG